jgi:hypothetical protein
MCRKTDALIRGYMAVRDESDGSSIGTGTYIAIVKLEKKIPKMRPMFGQKVTVKYQGDPKICRKYFQCHKYNISCKSKSWYEYFDQFIEENSGLPTDWFDFQDVYKEETQNENRDNDWDDGDGDDDSYDGVGH